MICDNHAKHKMKVQIVICDNHAKHKMTVQIVSCDNHAKHIAVLYMDSTYVIDLERPPPSSLITVGGEKIW